MPQINALSLAPDVKDWMTNSRQPQILHVFDQVCNLVNEHREVLSVVTSQIGNGPFNLVVEDELLFSEQLRLESPISVSPTQLHLGGINVNINNVKLWDPYPNWEMLRTRNIDILQRLASLPAARYKPALPNVLLSNLATSIVSADIESALTSVKGLAGLGMGLTPAGDDFIMGAMYAAWIIHPSETASTLTKEIANAAVPLTTSLSAAWLRSAGRGEAGILWHGFLDALNQANAGLRSPISRLLAVGETSGADALAGFMGVCLVARERMYN